MIYINYLCNGQWNMGLGSLGETHGFGVTVWGPELGKVGGVLDLFSSRRRGELMGMAASSYYSAQMVRAIPDDGRRYETVHGELLVTPAPIAWHQEVISRLGMRIRLFLERYPVGHLFASPADISYPVGHLFASPADISWGPDILVQPDLFVVQMDQAKKMEWSQMKDLLLAVEVLSPSTARYDRFTKRRLYQDIGIPLYWIVDLNAKCVEIWKPDQLFPEVAAESVTWSPTGVSDELIVGMEELFRPL